MNKMGKIVQQGYNNYRRGDIQGVVSLFSDDVEWQIPEMENVPTAGKRRGREQVAQFFKELDDNQEALQFEPQEFIAQGDKVVVLGHYVWRVKSTGRNYECDWAHVFTLRDGKVVKFQEYTDTAGAAAAYRKSD